MPPCAANLVVGHFPENAYLGKCINALSARRFVWLIDGETSSALGLNLIKNSTPSESHSALVEKECCLVIEHRLHKAILQLATLLVSTFF